MRLKELRKKKNITQLKLAMDLGLNQNAISRYETGEREADYKTLIALADYFEKEDIEKIDQPATSLNIETGMEINREIFLKKVIDNFCLRYNNFIEEGFLLIKEDYKRRAEFLDKTVTVKIFDKEIIGIAKDITDNGALKIVDKNNKEHVLLIGDIL